MDIESDRSYSLENALNNQEFYLIKDNSIYKVILTENKDEIIINIRNYFIKFNSIDLYLLTKIKFKSINNIYQFILNIFDNNNVLIKNVILDKEIILLMKFGENNLFELVLTYQQNYNIDIFNVDRIKQIQNEICILKKEHIIFKKEI